MVSSYSLCKNKDSITSIFESYIVPSAHSKDTEIVLNFLYCYFQVRIGKNFAGNTHLIPPVVENDTWAASNTKET